MTDQGNLWSALAVEPEDLDSETDSLATRYILVVEDEALVGLGLAAMLGNAGFDVIGPIGDLNSAMAILDQQSCALAILDIKLAHGETSAPIAERLKRAGIPFLVSSGNLNANHPDIFGDAPCLPKPVGARALVAAVQEALG